MKFSIQNCLIALLLLALVFALARSSSRLEETRAELEATRQELQSVRPISSSDVAREFERLAKTDSVIVTVEKDRIRYDPVRDRYLVQFSWTDTVTTQTHNSGLWMSGNGKGVYSATLYNDPWRTDNVLMDGEYISRGVTISIEDPMIRLERQIMSTAGEPSDAPKDRASRFDDGNTTAGPR